MRSRDQLYRRALVEVWLCGELLSRSYHFWELHTEQKHSGAHLLAHNDATQWRHLYIHADAERSRLNARPIQTIFSAFVGGNHVSLRLIIVLSARRSVSFRSPARRSVSQQASRHACKMSAGEPELISH